MTDTASAVQSLLPCPFCGGAARRSSSGKWHGTGCSGSMKCPAHLHALMFHTPEESDAAWNRRAQPMAPAVVEPPELSPDFTDTARAALLWVLWHHQGGSSPVGQPIRFALGMGQHDRLNEHQLSEAKRWERLHPVNPSVWAQKQDPLTDEQIDRLIQQADGLAPKEGSIFRALVKLTEAEVGKQDDALILQLVEALEYHRAQTRPIDRTDEAITAARARLEGKHA